MYKARQNGQEELSRLEPSDPEFKGRLVILSRDVYQIQGVSKPQNVSWIQGRKREHGGVQNRKRLKSREVDSKDEVR